jgi:hypothetical protein
MPSSLPVLLRPVGYWTSRPGDGLPDPRTLMSVKWERDRRSLIAAYLGSAAVLDTLDAKQICVICGADGGRRERTDGVWRWPETLAHYVAQHGVKLPDELVTHMAREDFRPPDVDVKALRDHLAPANPIATTLMSKAAAAAALDDMLGPSTRGQGSIVDVTPKKKKRAPSPPVAASVRPDDKTLTPADRQKPTPVAPRATADLEDATMAITTARKWTATVRGVPTKPQQIAFDRPIVVGRDRTCDVVLEHSSVSRRHARLVPEEGRVIVQDLDSQNGVWMKKTRISGQVAVKDGEEVSLGQATITLLR